MGRRFGYVLRLPPPDGNPLFRHGSLIRGAPPGDPADCVWVMVMIARAIRAVAQRGWLMVACGVGGTANAAITGR